MKIRFTTPVRDRMSLSNNKTEFRYVHVVVANSMKSKTLVFKQYGIYTDKK